MRSTAFSMHYFEFSYLWYPVNKIDLKTFLQISGLFIISRLLVLVSFIIALHYYSSYSLRGTNFQYCKSWLLNYLSCWDSGWYLDIAKNGYVFNDLSQGQSNYGFFPFYPIAMRILGQVVHNDLIAGIIISNVFLFLSSLFLFLLSYNIYKNRKTAFITVLVLFFFPGSYLLSGVFSESAFICFSIMCIYFFKTDNYFLCGLSGFFLSLTRPFGIMILLPLSLMYIFRHGLEFRSKILYLITSVRLN